MVYSDADLRIVYGCFHITTELSSYDTVWLTKYLLPGFLQKMCSSSREQMKGKNSSCLTKDRGANQTEQQPKRKKEYYIEDVK